MREVRTGIAASHITPGLDVDDRDNVIMGIDPILGAFGCMTCCIGFLILMIPYIGTVVLLPMYVTFRGLDLEFLAQFGEEYDLVALFPQDEPQAGPPPIETQ